MATPRLIANYGPEFAKLMRRARQDKTVVRCLNPNEAKRYRARLYAYRRALALAPESAPDVALVAPFIKMSIEGSSLALEIDHERFARIAAKRASAGTTPNLP